LIIVKTLRAIVFVFGLIAFSSAYAQQPVPPPPQPAANGPSLEVTMKFIQDKLNEQGKIGYVEFLQNVSDGSTNPDTHTNEISNMVADPGQCRISYHRRATSQGQTYKDENDVFSLRDVQDIVIKPLEQYVTEWSAKNGQPNIICTSVSPAMTALIVRRPHGELNYFDFSDAALADRVAKALTHAVELCGGGNKDPF
jgi:hypothetical protein